MCWTSGKYGNSTANKSGNDVNLFHNFLLIRKIKYNFNQYLLQIYILIIYILITYIHKIYK